MDNYKNTLEHVAKTFSSVDNGFCTTLSYYVYRTVLPFLKIKNGIKILEVGCADGAVTKHLLKHDVQLTCLDGSKTLLDKLPDNDKVKKINCLLEEAEPIGDIDLVLCSFVLEHVENQYAFLSHLSKFGNQNTIFFICVPNSFSYHRQAALSVNMIEKIDQFSPSDYAVCHKRYYNPFTFKNDVGRYFNVLNTGGIMFKPLPDNDMFNCNFSTNKETLYEMYYRLGQQHPNECSSIYILADKLEEKK